MGTADRLLSVTDGQLAEAVGDSGGVNSPSIPPTPADRIATLLYVAGSQYPSVCVRTVAHAPCLRTFTAASA